MNLNQASTFLTNWVTENINADAYPVNKKEARRLAKVCEEAAEEQGITKAQLEEVAGQDLVNYMMHAQEDATDAEVDRLAAKDH